MNELRHKTKIVAFYDKSDFKDENRVYSPSTVTVVDYMSDCLRRLGKQVEIISAAETRNGRGFYRFRSNEVSKGITLTQGFTIGFNNRFLRSVSKSVSRLWLVSYLLKNTFYGERIVFYDQPVLYIPLLLFRILSKHKRVIVIYFASELFQKVYNFGWLKRELELYLFAKADRLVVSTELLNMQINKQGRPYTIMHGTYRVAEKSREFFGDGLIHIVYAGIINAKKGSRQAVDLAGHLNKNYMIHILGFGVASELEYIKERIHDSNMHHACKVSYEGVLSGREYEIFLQKCHIGLCTQNLNEAYNDSSFPSKILVYLANGLRVVSVRLDAIENSEIGDLLYYSNSDKSKDISDAIMKIDFNESYDSRAKIEQLDKKFLQEFGALIR